MSWKCQYCNQIASFHVSSSDSHTVRSGGESLKTDKGYTLFTSRWDLCPDPQCSKITFTIFKYNCPSAITSSNGQYHGVDGKAVKLEYRHQILPESAGKLFPEYIPAAINQDYQEACRILHLSPKASATLLRRCLQGMIRDFWGITKRTLHAEIAALEAQEPGTKDLIDPIRSIGNIGAHMEADVNLIIDIEPEEAALLKEMIEQLVDDWYIERHKREERIAKIKAVAAEKELKRKGDAA